MKSLLRKEFRLALHPAAALFPALAAMMLIPNYPLTVTFFYPCLGAFFLSLSSRENGDLRFTALLPVEKRDIPRARVLFTALLQLAQVALCVPFCFLRSFYPPAGNAVGLDANLALLGFGLVEMGLFNLVFFPRLFRNPSKVGGPFLLGSAALFLWACVTEVLPHTVPFLRDRLDTPLFQYPAEKAACFLLGLALYAVLTLLASRISEKRFVRIDL